ncbi:MAG: type II toxin-antitoxin system mRNA interferase toxin, RelE/StbE family [Deltaproteobacteria bacterium]|nr:type II toxin-antitoxin system mRNA interferase toxin, RelE/StbE family [Deltaproteobacteria bacterium]
MIEAVWDRGFKRSYRKRIHRHSHLKRQFRERMKLFLEEPFDPQLRTHKLSGKLKGTWGFSINDDYRVLFEFLDKDKVMLIDFGTHDEVY